MKSPDLPILFPPAGNRMYKFPEDTQGCLQGVLSYYNTMKLGTRMNQSEARPIYDDLSKRFAMARCRPAVEA